MAAQSLFSMLEVILQNLKLPFSPPVWAVDEFHRRVVLLLNHVLMQEPQAMERLVRQKGNVVRLQWRDLTFKVQVTPAGLLDVALPDVEADLSLVITEDSPLAIAQELLQGGKPGVRVEGDVQLAAEVNWLIDHVRWDLEEDLARMLGDAPAHAMAQAFGAMANALRQFVGTRRPSGSDGSSA